MANLPKRPCLQPGCPELVTSGRCSKHQRNWNTRRGTTKERGYGADWQAVRAMKLRQDPLCEIRTHCDGALATEVDHIVPIREAPELRLDMANLQSACKACNVAKATSGLRRR